MNLDDVIGKAKRRAAIPKPVVRRSIREEANLTQAEIGSAIGVDRATISRWEASLCFLP